MASSEFLPVLMEDHPPVQMVPGQSQYLDPLLDAAMEQPLCARMETLQKGRVLVPKAGFQSVEMQIQSAVMDPLWRHLASLALTELQFVPIEPKGLPVQVNFQI